jgi:hypothetical protein
MAAENIGNLIPTKIPSLIDNADIQEALRLYHYGSYDFDFAETNTSNLINPSIAYTINSLQNQITSQVALELAARDSSRVSNEPPTAADFTSFMTGIPNGYVWMDKNAQSSVGYFAATSVYTTTAPTQNLTNGLIWVEKGSSPLKMYVYNSTTSTFDQIGA